MLSNACNVPRLQKDVSHVRIPLKSLGVVVGEVAVSEVGVEWGWEGRLVVWARVWFDALGVKGVRRVNVGVSEGARVTKGKSSSGLAVQEGKEQQLNSREAAAVNANASGFSVVGVVGGAAVEDKGVGTNAPMAGNNDGGGGF